MHEAAIASGILDAVTEAMSRHETATLLAVHVRIGRLAGVVPDCLSFAWDVLREDTVAAGVPLEIEEVPVTACCRACACEYAVADLDLSCPTCGSLDVEMLTGRELEVAELEVEP